MEPRSVLVTGCSTGIGLALAVRLAKDEHRRFKVYATMRNLGKRHALEKAAGETLNDTLEIRQLDVCSEDSVRECVNGLPDRRVDVLVNNAGVGMIGPLECQSIASMRELFNTNFLGLARLVKEIFPDMKRRQSGHIVVMSSVLGLHGLLFNEIYSASKFAVEGFCESLGLQALKFNVRVTLMEPGPVLTEFERKLYEEVSQMDMAGTDQETARIFQEIYLPYSMQIFSALAQTPEEIAQQTFEVIVSEDPPFRHQTNRLYMPLTAMRKADSSAWMSNAAIYHSCFNLGPLFYASMGLMRMVRWMVPNGRGGLSYEPKQQLGGTKKREEKLQE
ncbi:retinol dehydrogenase 8 [Engraulis encrasicolus]|uniref:retinol dehydrogenase 8 n=1 Tax=Engraulis encrasicolus TaxID=184585 RepID=UPI002FCF261B